jgi:solute carrier family 35 protein F1/2
LFLLYLISVVLHFPVIFEAPSLHPPYLITTYMMSSSNKHNNVEEVIPIDALNEGGTTYNDEAPITLRQRFGRKRTSWFQYIKTKGDSLLPEHYLTCILISHRPDFWLVLLLGQVLSICITSTNTLSSLLASEGTNIPAFQTLFNYILLNLIYTSFTLYRYGWRKWLRLIYKDGWRYFILAFMDVEGNYFTVIAYRYTTILSAQLINFWAIVAVVLISFFILGVRYHLTQYLGILICIGGTGE